MSAASHGAAVPSSTHTSTSGPVTNPPPAQSNTPSAVTGDSAPGGKQFTTGESTDPVEDDDDWTEGDVAIVSSDRVRFRISSYHICSASPVLRAQLEGSRNEGRVVCLDNKAYNTGTTMRHFLNVVTKGDVDSVPTDHLYLLVHFLKVYECHVFLKLVLGVIRDYHRAGKIDPTTTFTLGSVAFDKETLRQALEAYESKWPKDGSQNEDTQYTVGPVSGSYVFDPISWSLELWDKIPSEVVHALMAAWAKKKSCPDLPQKFLEQMEKAIRKAASYSGHTPETSPSEIVDDPGWTHGDFELISTNNVRFLVNSFDLFAHSRVFRAGQLLCDSNMSVAFTDPEIETSETIQDFLELIESGGVANVRYHLTSRTSVPLINFLIKYDCPTVLSGFLRYLRETIYDGTASSIKAAFLAGIAADDPKTCAVALKVRGRRWSNVVASPLWDPRSWPLRYWRLLPTTYFWALCRAWDRVGDTKRLPTEFPKWLEVAKGVNGTENG